ncbi:hypothetical protein OF83DRAFT_1081034 [Amylostereum chailletii]|nr:hypothetical protein OF83DRAFT_1081034 [Amylostereum chailletii]
MESEAARQKKEEARQAALRKQIAALQAQLCDPNDIDDSSERLEISTPHSPKRARSDGQVLAPSSPSPKRRRIESDTSRSHASSSRSVTSSRARNLPSGSSRRSAAQRVQPPPPPKPSTLLIKLSQINSRSQDTADTSESKRSSSFAVKASCSSAEDPKIEDVGTAPVRDDRLALIEDLEPGPYEHKAPFDDPLFEKLEPHSGIHLTSRLLSHDDLQEYMTSRYYISPSKLYSVIRLLPNNQGYDVPVVGDWVTIGVIAERGPTRVSRAPVNTGPSTERDSDDDGAIGGSASTSHSQGKDKGKGKNSKDEPPPTSSGRKYVNLKLIDFGTRGRGGGVNGKAAIRGDAFLSLLLFQADSEERIPGEGAAKPKTIYRGGSRGAFEQVAKLREGAVIALLNPRVLKPFQKAVDKPHPTNNILALTPESIDSVAIIGYARDLGMCDVRKKDGKICGGWCDKRLSEVCEYHLQAAVERRRAARPEFSAGTMGMSTSAPKRKKPAYDPLRKWGLVPESKSSTLSGDAGGATYVVSGHVVNDTRALYVGENIGREAQARAQRAGVKQDDALKVLLARDKEGMRAVEKAREYAAMMKTKAGEKGNKKGKAKEVPRGDDDEEETQAESASTTALPPTKSAYTAEVIKKLGFDPTIRPGHKRESDGSGMHSQLNRLASQRASKPIELGPRPGKKFRSNVRAPNQRLDEAGNSFHGGDNHGDIPDSVSDDELEIREQEVFGRRVGAGSAQAMVNLDSSEDELVVDDPAE